ncbi:hypothetical protein, partial [Leyella stercorea]|uniref:hypothetical protein n=1 Tax=Leyella stercorea TaxID=363265 RepID=UPI002431EC7E
MKRNSLFRFYLYESLQKNEVGEKICHIFQQRRSQLAMKRLRAGRCRLYLPGFERIFHQIIGGYSILAIPTLS